MEGYRREEISKSVHEHMESIRGAFADALTANTPDEAVILLTETLREATSGLLAECPVTEVEVRPDAAELGALLAKRRELKSALVDEDQVL